MGPTQSHKSQITQIICDCDTRTQMRLPAPGLAMMMATTTSLLMMCSSPATTASASVTTLTSAFGPRGCVGGGVVRVAVRRRFPFSSFSSSSSSWYRSPLPRRPIARTSSHHSSSSVAVVVAAATVTRGGGGGGGGGGEWGERRRTTAPLPLPPGLDDDRANDVSAALLSVLVACRAARSVQPSGLVDDDHDVDGGGVGTASKGDSSPVTIGDYACQALALDVLGDAFPFDAYVAEEGSDALRNDGDDDDDDDDTRLLADRVLEVANRGAISTMMDADRLLRAIDRGGRGTDDAMLSSSSSEEVGDDGGGEGRRRRRVWCLDPIDGTKGFLRGRFGGGQYCVALALLEDGVPVLGVLGCPNLPGPPSSSGGGGGRSPSHDGGGPSSSAAAAAAAAVMPFGKWSEEEIDKEKKESMTRGVSSSRPSTFFPSTSSRGRLFLAVRGQGCYEIPLHVLERHFLGDLGGDYGDDDDASAGAEGSSSHSKCASSPDDEATTMSSSSWKRLRVGPSSDDGTSATPGSRDARFCLGVERSFSDPDGTVLEIARIVLGPDALIATTTSTTTGGEEDGGTGSTARDIANCVRMDGQGKYGLLARGDAECFLRLPREGYVDWVWDVAAGYLVLTEAGGEVTDVAGLPIDFSEIGAPQGVFPGGGRRRAKLPDSVRGIVGSCGGALHRALLDAHAEIRGRAP